MSAGITTTAPITKPASDPRFERVPTERIAMLLIVPRANGKADRIIITETSSGGRLTLDSGDSILDREVSLNVRELRFLAEMAQKIATRTAKRPEWKP